MTNTTKTLAEIVTGTVALCQDKFKDPETGRGPDYSLELRYSRPQQSYSLGFYVPALNNLGANDWSALTLRDSSVVLPWPHEDSWRLLMDEYLGEPPSELVVSQNQNWKAVVAGIKAGQVIFTPDRIPSCAPTISGGSRAGKEVIRGKMKRPWQVHLKEHNLDSCELCNGSQINPTVEGDLKIFSNNSTPYPFHRMIIPTKEYYQSCRDSNEFLTDPQRLGLILETASRLSDESGFDNLRLLVHIGYTGGQNYPHLHFHFVPLI
ncbi:MAG: hypothetical protein PHF67_03975 [Candidatus Nanoarchaeia archaeon]|nr:hypothetical protein [Candidatus Nanoarchaeia archaeon]